MLRSLFNGMVHGGAAIAAGAVGLKSYEFALDKTDNQYIACGLGVSAGVGTYQAVNLVGKVVLDGAEDAAGVAGCKLSEKKKNKKSKKDEEDEED